MKEDIHPEALKAVQNGIAFFDEAYPDWRDRVIPGTFDVYDPNKCPLARASGMNYYAAEINHGNVHWAVRHGFVVLLCQHTMGDLQRAWNYFLNMELERKYYNELESK